MACESCANCRHCEYKPVGENHLGSNGKDYSDWYCWYFRKWLGDCSGKCKNYKEK